MAFIRRRVEAGSDGCTEVYYRNDRGATVGVLALAPADDGEDPSPRTFFWEYHSDIGDVGHMADLGAALTMAATDAQEWLAGNAAPEGE
jgi:hypothetical protein